MDVATVFAARLRCLREQAGLSRQELADRAGVSIRSLEKWEQGIREPVWSLAVALARALAVSTDQFAVPGDAEDTADAAPRGRGRPAKPATAAQGERSAGKAERKSSTAKKPAKSKQSKRKGG